jgi:CXXX repeat modification system protein
MITENEKIELLNLYERKNSLIELQVIADKNYFNEFDKETIRSIKEDIEKNDHDIAQWWKVTLFKYGISNDSNCYVRFSENCIYNY